MTLYQKLKASGNPHAIAQVTISLLESHSVKETAKILGVTPTWALKDWHRSLKIPSIFNFPLLLFEILEDVTVYAAVNTRRLPAPADLQQISPPSNLCSSGRSMQNISPINRLCLPKHMPLFLKISCLFFSSPLLILKQGCALLRMPILSILKMG